MRCSASKLYRSMTLRKRRIWLEKAIEKLEKTGIEILWIRPLYLYPGFIFEVKTKKTVLELRVCSKSSWRIYNTHNTTYRITRSIEECIKEIESGKD
jgi:hypothetical protein